MLADAAMTLDLSETSRPASRSSTRLSQAELQGILLELLQAVTQVCAAEHIEYFLIAGGCLGIVRHNNGFVPWDDDLDIAVQAGDVPRLLAALQRLPHPWRVRVPSGTLNPTIKVYDASTALVIQAGRETPEESDLGVFLDILPMMHWRSARWKRLDDLYAWALALRDSRAARVWWKPPLKRLIHYSGAGHLLRACGRRWFQPLMERMDSACRAKGEGIISGATGCFWVARCPRTVIYPLRTARLVSVDVQVPHDLDGYLRLRYGDNYRQLPDPARCWRHFAYAVRREPLP